MKTRRPPTSEYTAFQDAIADTPYNPGVWNQYIDWLTEQDRLREAAIARLALQQRLQFGPPGVAFYRDNVRFEPRWIIADFVDTFPDSLLDYCRRVRYHRRCEFQTRQSPKSGLWEYRAVGPDPQEHPLDCPPLDERRRRSRWKPYPDEWFAVWADARDGDGWKPLIRYRMLNQARGHARDVSSVHACCCVVRDQNGRLCHRYREGQQIVDGPGFPMDLPEDLYPDSVV